MNLPLHRSLSRHARSRPEAIAIETASCSVTYAELEQCSDRIARGLVERGVEQGSIVALHLDRGPELVAAIFGVLKAGAAYATLDPSYPRERLQHILEDAAPRVLIGAAEALIFDGARVEYEALAHGEAVEEIEPRADELAYALFTSGSTGRPKGIAMSRRTVETFLAAIDQTIGVREDDVYLHAASFSFSASVRQLFLPLSRGARIYLASREEVRDPNALLEIFKTRRITIADGVPTLWANTARAAREPLHDLALHTLLTGGEPVTFETWRELRRVLNPKLRLFNNYAQTETLGTSLYRAPEELESHAGFVPAGTLYAHHRAHLRDGELYLESDAIFSRHLNRPDLDRERTITLEDGKSAFKTGDRARFGEGGVLEITGRAGTEVKIRGMRVDLREVEAVLLADRRVAEAAVELRDGEKLVAWVVFDRSHGGTVEALKETLREKLPDYLVPAFIVVLEVMPRTATGKLDRRALPDLWDRRELARTVKYAHETGPRLAALWSELLGVAQIGGEESFFDLGGHSLLATQLLMRIEKEWRVELPLSTLVKAPTIDALSTEIARALRGEITVWTPLVPLFPDAAKPQMFFIHGIFGNVLGLHELARRVSGRYSVYALEARGVDGRDAPYESVEEIAASYLRAIREVQPHGPYRLTGYSFGGTVAFEMARQLAAAGESVERIALLDTFSTLMFQRRTFSDKLADRGRHLLQEARALLTSKRVVDGPVLMIDAKINEEVAGSRYRAESHRVAHHHRRAAKAYRYPKYSGRVKLFRASDRTGLPQSLMRHVDPLLGWGESTERGVDLHVVGGSHVSMLESPHVEEIAAEL